MKETITAFSKKTYKYLLAHKIMTAVGVVVIASGGYYFFKDDAQTVLAYQYTQVMRGDISSTVSATGQVTPNSQVDLKPKVNANVVGVYVKSGDRVKSGQVLFRLDATDAYKQVRDAKTSLESANLSLQKLRTPQTVDILSIQNSLKQEVENKRNQDTKVATAYRNLLINGLQVQPEVAYTTETAPTLSGSYTKGVEGQIKITVYQGGPTGYSFSVTGIAAGQGSVNMLVPQPIADTGLYIKWNTANPQTNWLIDIPNKQSINYSSNYTAWQNALDDRVAANAASDRNIESLNQKLADLTPGDDDLDVQSAKLTVTQRQNALSDAQTSLSNYVITAPFDGVMASVSVDIGSSAVMASANSSTALGTIVTDKKLAQITLNESDIVKVSLGQKAKITFDAIEGLVVDGDVVEVTTLGTVTSGVVTYKVKVAFNSNDTRILPNMSVSVDILTDSKTGVLYVPSQAVKHDTNGYYVEEDMQGGQMGATSTRRFTNSTSTMYTSTSTATSTFPNGGQRNATGTQRRTVSSVAGVTALRRIPVTIGVQNDTQTEIISGISEGETIVLKKVTSATSATASAPSITSLFRGSSGRATTVPVGGGNAGFVRPQ